MENLKTPAMLLNNMTLSFIFIPTFLLEESVYYIPKLVCSLSICASVSLSHFL